MATIYRYCGCCRNRHNAKGGVLSIGVRVTMREVIRRTARAQHWCPVCCTDILVPLRSLSDRHYSPLCPRHLRFFLFGQVDEALSSSDSAASRGLLGHAQVIYGGVSDASPGPKRPPLPPGQEESLLGLSSLEANYCGLLLSADQASATAAAAMPEEKDALIPLSPAESS